ncbi:MAG: cobalamin-dependent protein [Deltaproteobacteria bacterium]|nr:cobalamin-dependent protein [Deltaproteobacteria bacterium]
MRFMLINPFYPISETPSPPLGSAFIAAVLENAGIEVKLLDFVVYPYSKDILETEVNNFQPDFVGLTSVTMTFDNAIGIVKDVKNVDPNIITVMGGPHVTFCAEETLGLYPELDFIVIGEGEETIVELTRTARNDRKWADVKGIAYRDGSRAVITEARPFTDVNTLPLPARHLTPLGRYRALGMPISMTSSRGCPFHCIFCVGRKMVGAKIRYRNARNVVDEMEYLSTLGFHQINLADDLFTANKKHCHEVCDEIIRRGVNIKWTSFARVDTVSTDVLIKMKAAGCQAVSFGIESANAQILETIKKGITLKQVVDAIKMCNTAGIMPHGSFILGLPGETPETIRETVDFGLEMKKLGLSYGFHLLAPFPGTEIRDRCDHYGIKIMTHDWTRYHANRAIVETPATNQEMMDEIVIKWENEYNNELDHIKKRIAAGKATAEEAEPLINLERIVLTYDLMMGRMIEKRGTWHETGSGVDKDPLKTLSVRLQESVKVPLDRIYGTLKPAVEHKNLKLLKTGTEFRWEWVDYL